MLIIPAIDIINGKCVRLTKGDYKTSKIYSENPLEIAKIYESHGIKNLHLVDLEGAKGKGIVNHKILEEISNIENTVVGTGGGVIISSENREIIKNLGFVVYLTANIKELVYRTAQDKSRPLIKDTNAEKIMFDIIIYTSFK